MQVIIQLVPADDVHLLRKSHPPCSSNLTAADATPVDDRRRNAKAGLHAGDANDLADRAPSVAMSFHEDITLVLTAKRARRE